MAFFFFLKKVLFMKKWETFICIKLLNNLAPPQAVQQTGTPGRGLEIGKGSGD